MSSIHDLYSAAYPLALQAVQADTSGDHNLAAQRYYEVYKIFNRILKRGEYDLVVRKSNQYTQRANAIRASLTTPNADTTSVTLGEALPEYVILEREAKETYDQGVAEHRKQHEQEALNCYIKSAELYMDSWKSAPEGSSARLRLDIMIKEVIALAEDLKAVPVHSLLNVKAGSTPLITGPSKLTPQEVKVLKDTMIINGKKYHPWGDADIEELFRDNVIFDDPDGKLPLSAEQEKNFGAWKRASEIMDDPKMVWLVSSSNIVQEVVTDCSFVASLCVSASYERRRKKHLIRACIYPKNKYGEPEYNPYGKYLVKLFFNGIPRRVVIDDYLPVSRTGELMCTCSKNKNELWPSIIEKAYMKVMGGYNFPGSNSGTDLYALTGWIPEHVFFRDCNRNLQWERILNGQRAGTFMFVNRNKWYAEYQLTESINTMLGLALVTIATGFMDEESAEEKGLVPTHAYAVLDMREVEGLRLMQVKNPWSRKRWKGKFSHLDAENWTPELLGKLEYDQSAALEKDDGIFWIDYESVCNEFDTIHINWNPEMLRHRSVIHAPWPNSSGRKRDNRNLGNNPQFTLVTNVKTPDRSNVWLLLSKHITETEEKIEDYIALHVFDIEALKKNPNYRFTMGSTSSIMALATSETKAGSSSSHRQPTLSLAAIAESKGTKIYYEDDFAHKGAYVNSQHTLVRLDAPQGVNEYTVVLSQNVKSRDLHFTLRVFAMCEHHLKPIPNKYSNKLQIKGEWTEETAGGNKCCSGFMNNPQYRLVVPELPAPQTTTSLLLSLETPESSETAGIVEGIPLLVQLVYSNGDRMSSVWSKDVVAQAREYRRTFNYCETDELKAGTYTVIVSTYDPGIIGRYTLTMESQIKLALTPIPAEGAGMFKKKIEGRWAKAQHRGKDMSFARNPYYVVYVTEMTELMVRLQVPKLRSQSSEEKVPALAVDIYQRLEDGVVGKLIVTSGFAAIPQGVSVSVKSLPGSKNGYLIVLSTDDPNPEGEFLLIVYSDREVRTEAMEGVLR
ncbi:calpain 7 [Mortierella sp. GBA43]|nr:calpain 7 [Mortierella sp. GBA43]